MSNTELKTKLWENLSKKYSHLNDYCTIELRGIEDDASYFHPIFRIDDDISVYSQCDTKNKYIYATKFSWVSKNIFIDISEHLLDAIIIGCYTNRNSVELAMDTMAKVRNHIRTLDNYTTDYINNILIGNSVNETTNAFINELKANQKLIEFMQNNR